MELNSVNRLNVSHFEQSGVHHLKNIDKVQLDSHNRPLKIDRVELQNQSSPFANNLMNNVKQISTALHIQSTVSKQLNLTTEIKQSINSVISDTNNSQTLNDIQPKIQKLMDKFNTLSNHISNSTSIISTNPNDKPKSRIYFDGILGSKPLSIDEIFKEVKSQEKRLESINKVANDKIFNTTQKSKKMFEAQKQELVAQQPKIKQFDFAVESSNFKPEVIQKMQGSVVDTQANAKTEQNIKLLAS